MWVIEDPAVISVGECLMARIFCFFSFYLFLLAASKSGIGIQANPADIY